MKTCDTCHICRTCRDCIAFDRGVGYLRDGAGLCKANPPAVGAVTWPIVQPTDWCLGFQRRPYEAQEPSVARLPRLRRRPPERLTPAEDALYRQQPRVPKEKRGRRY